MTLGIALTRRNGTRECQKCVWKAEKESARPGQGGIAMRQGELKDEIERVVRRVLPLVPKDKAVEKSEFKVILNEILTCLHESTQIDINTIAQKTRKVLGDLPNEYGQLPKDARSWETVIGYLYAKYLKELGRI